MDAKLVIVGGKANRSQVSVRLPAIVGRSREADLTVAHPMISRKHCRLYELDGLVMIRDLGSLNGTFLGRKQIAEAPLHPEAEFTVGPLTFRIEYEYSGRIAAERTPVPSAEPPETPALSFGVGGDARHPDGVRPAQVEARSETDETLPVQRRTDSEGPGPAIAPPDGALPDFAASELGGGKSPSQGGNGDPSSGPGPNPAPPPSDSDEQSSGSKSPEDPDDSTPHEGGDLGGDSCPNEERVTGEPHQRSR